MDPRLLAHRWVRRIVGLSTVAAAVAGCSWSQEPDTPPNFTVRQENDITAPQSFEWDKDKSWAEISWDSEKLPVGRFRSSQVVYRGDQQVGVLVHWYSEEMKKDGWTQKSLTEEKKGKCLTFFKGEDMAKITLYREFDPRFDKYLTFVVGRVGPIPVEALSPEEHMSQAGASLTGAEETEEDEKATPAAGTEKNLPKKKDLIQERPLEGADTAPAADTSGKPEMKESPDEETTSAPDTPAESAAEGENTEEEIGS